MIFQHALIVEWLEEYLERRPPIADLQEYVDETLKNYEAKEKHVTEITQYVTNAVLFSIQF